LSQNMFANPNACRPLIRAILGIGLALAAIGAIGFGCGVATAAPQQPLLVDDPVPVPTPAGPNPANAVNIANAIFGELDAVLNAVFPGSGSVLMPADTGTNSLLPGSAYPGVLSPGQTPGLPGYPGALPGQTPGLPGYPGAVPPGYPTTAVPGQLPGVPGSPAPLLPGQAAVPGSPAPIAPGLPTPSPATLGQVSPGQSVPVV
jgi:hypothetical protein